MHTILVPLDGSERAEAILPHVEKLAGCFESRVVLLRVIEPLTTPVTAEVILYAEEMLLHQEQAQQYLEGVRARLAEAGVTAAVLLGFGSVPEAILHAAETAGADLIAMASHGRSGLAHVFYGSVTAGVMHRIDRPLLLIRAGGGAADG